MKLKIKEGTTSKLVKIFVQDSSATDGSGLTGLLYNTASLSAYYLPEGDATATSITLATATVGTFTSGGFKEVDSTNLPGVYEVGLPDAVIDATSEGSVIVMLKGAANMAPVLLEVELDGIDYRTGLMTSNVTQISGDATAADNLELMYDGTGYTDDTAPSSRSQIGSLSSASGGVSTTAESFTKAGAEPETNTYTSTVQEDDTYHIVEDDVGSTDVYYQFDVGGNGVPQSFEWSGYAQSINDSYDVFAYNWGGTAWEQIGTVEGAAGTSKISLLWLATTAHVGTGTDLGKVRLRFFSSDGTAIATDRLLCTYAIVAQSIGYANGAIWVDTNATNTNTEPYVDGVADNPVSTWAAALTLSASLGITRFQVAKGSSITLTGNSDGYVLTGEGYALSLGSNTSIDGFVAIGANPLTGSGNVSPTTNPTFIRCFCGQLTIPASNFLECGIGLENTSISGASSGEYIFADCYSLRPGTGSPWIILSGLTATGTSAQIRRWSGGLDLTYDQDVTASVEVLAGGRIRLLGSGTGATVEVRGICRELEAQMVGTDVVQFVGTTGPITLSGTTTGTVNLHGVSTSLTDTTSAATVTDNTIRKAELTTIEGKVDTVDTVVDTILVDTNELQTDWTDGGRLDLILDAASTQASVDTIDSNVDAILVDTDITIPGLIAGLNDPTASVIADAVWDEILTGATHNIATSAGRRLRELAASVVWTGTAQGSGTGSNQIQLDAGASATDNAYDPALISIIAGTGAGQTRLVLQYDGTTKIATVDRDWKVNPSTDSEFVINGDAGREHVNEGLAQAGTANTITLNALASATDNAYVGQVVFIRSGTGADQVGYVTAYNGTTKVATIKHGENGGNWGTTPDTTSAYVMLAMHVHTIEEIAEAVRTEMDANSTQLSGIIEDTAEIGVAGAGLSAIPWNASWDAEIQSEVDDALVARGLHYVIDTALPTGWTTDVTADSALDQMADNGTAEYNRATDSLQALRDRGDSGAWAGAAGTSPWSSILTDYTTPGTFGARFQEATRYTNTSANIRYVVRGDSYDGTANAALSWAVTKDFSGFTGTMTIRHRITDAVLLSASVTVQSATELQVSLTTSDTAFALLTTDADFGPHPYDLEMVSGSSEQSAVRGVVVVSKDQTTA